MRKPNKEKFIHTVYVKYNVENMMNLFSQLGIYDEKTYYKSIDTYEKHLIEGIHYSIEKNIQPPIFYSKCFSKAGE